MFTQYQTFTLFGYFNIFSEHRYDNISEETAVETKLKLFTVRSRIKVSASSEDDRVKYTCKANHEALSEPLKSTIQIRVLCEYYHCYFIKSLKRQQKII